MGQACAALAPPVHPCVCRAGTENSSSWPGFFEGAIVTGEDVANELDGLLKQSGGSAPQNIDPAAAWNLPRSHTKRLVTGFEG